MSEVFFADVQSADVENAVLTAYERITGTTLYPADPVRLFLESLAYTISVQNNVINMAGRQNLLAYAQGEHLDYIGMMVGTARLGASRAVAMQRFALAGPLDFDVAVPAGTRVTTSDGAARFALETGLIIPAGATEADGQVRAEQEGAAANGLVPGQIDQLVDPVAYVASTRNVGTSMLGSDVEADDRYRARIQLAPESYTCAGPIGAYRHHALRVHQDIAEAAVWSPKPGHVDVRPVMSGGELPSADVLEAVRRALSADDVRPLTDTVTVQAPELVTYDLRLTWYLSRTQEPLLDTVRGRVAAAVERYRLWQRSMPGRDILPLRLCSLLEQAGVRRVELASPGYQALKGYQLAREGEISVAFGGIEDD